MTTHHHIYSEERGDLLPVELDTIPFEVKRVFIVYNVPKGVPRGSHAHHRCQQYLLCVNGEIEVTLISQKEEKRVFVLNKGQGCLVDTYVWDSQKFLTGNDVLLVFCSIGFDRNDYITDFEKFKE